MFQFHRARSLMLGATTAIALTTMPSPAALAATPIAPLKQLQRRLMIGEARERFEKYREFRRTRAFKRGAGFRMLEVPADRTEGGGPQGAPATSAPESRTPSRLSAADSPPLNHIVNNRTGDGASAGQSETSIAAWGTKVVAAFNDGQGFTSGLSTQGYATSTDGGTTWIDGGEPPVSGGITEWTSDPVIAVNEKTGEFYYAGLCSPSSTTNGVGIVKGTWTGNTFTWGTPVLVRSFSNSTNFIDKEWVAVDSSGATGKVYLTYTNFTTSADQIELQRSTDAGATWSAATKISDTADDGAVQGSRPAVGPNGELYVMWYVIGPIDVDFFKIRKSVTQGASFGAEATAVSGYFNYGTGAPGFNRGQGITFASLAVDRTVGAGHSGRVYLAWNESLNFYDDDLALGAGGAQAEVEGNDTPATANAFVLGKRLTGAISTAGDLDYFSFAGVASQTVMVHTTGVAGTLSYTLRLFCSDGTTRMAFAQGEAGANVVWIFTLPVNGTYTLRVASTGSTGAYQVRTGFAANTGERGRDHRDAFVTWSDNGTTWSNPPVRINDEPAGLDDWLPEVAVSGQGRVYAAWYDWRDAAAGTCGGQSNIYLARSDNGGASWFPLGTTSDATSVWTNVASNIQPNQGDYMSLFANNTAIYPCWSDGRLGNPDAFVSVWPLALTPTQVSLVSADAEPDRVRLEWYVADPNGFVATLERRNPGGLWSALGSLTPDGTGHLRYEDTDVTPGEQLEYRLAVPDNGGTAYLGLVTVLVPHGLTLALAGARPNPAQRELAVSFTIPTAAPATLALLDVSGRLVRSIDVGALGAGAHTVDLGSGASLAPGMYVIRLVQGDRTLTTRVSIVR